MGRPGRPKKRTVELVVKDIKRQTRRKFSAEEKIKIEKPFRIKVFCYILIVKTTPIPGTPSF